jgi:hypothetical protein
MVSIIATPVGSQNASTVEINPVAVTIVIDDVILHRLLSTPLCIHFDLLIHQ